MKRLPVYTVVLIMLCTRSYAAQSISGTVRIPAGEYACYTIDLTADTIVAIPPRSADRVTGKAKQAMSFAPHWLSIALEDRFSTLSADLQDTLAQIILDADDPIVDEIAFTIAHMPKEVLTNSGFHFQLLEENARGVYCADTGLDYVTIIDSGSAATGGDYHSTTRYTVLENGAETLYTLPRELYYWYIVHPKLQGELPAYITPDNPSPSAPPRGKFWRSFLWGYSEPSYCALSDTMKGMTFLWANKINSPAENGALGRLSQWCNRVLPWGDHPAYRWPQPVYLSHQHCGTCSEHGWFANAAARTALIPVTLTKAPRFDHKWNEFYYKRWIDWEPINGWIARIDEPNHADDYWSDKSKPPLNGCFNWRSDGFIEGTTEHYSPVCTLAVTVTDADQMPVDGARITVDAEGVPGNFLMAGWTGSDGRCRFLLGDEIDYFTAAVQSSLGNIAAAKVISSSRAGKKYEWSPMVPKTVKVLKPTLENTAPVGSGPSVSIACRLDATREIVYGRHEYSLYNYSFPCTFSDERPTGTTDFFICDSVNLTKHKNGGPFNVLFSKSGMTMIDTVFILPRAMGKCFFVVSGEGKGTVTALVNSSITVQSGSGGRRYGSTHSSLKRIGIYGAVKQNTLRVTFTCAEPSRCSVVLYTVAGTVVTTLFDGIVGSGMTIHSFHLDRVPAGAYICALQAGTDYRRQQIVAVK